MGSLRAAFATLPDARRGQGRMYAKGDILTLAVCAMVCGARSQYAVSRWIAAASTPIREAVGWGSERIPSGPTIHRVLAGVQAGEIEYVLHGWLEEQELHIGTRHTTPTKRGVHGEQLPGSGIVERIADTLSEHLRLTGTSAASGGRSPWDRFFGRMLYGGAMPADMTPAEMQLRRAMLHTVGSGMA